MKKSRHRLTFEERVIIETLLGQNKSKSYIAKYLDRNRSSITREINNWVKNPEHKYEALLAHFCVKQNYLNKRNQDKINQYNSLKIFVYRGLLNFSSPEQIAGHIKKLYPNNPIMIISYEAIYQHIYRHRQSKLGRKLIALLPYHHHKRRFKRKFGQKRTRIKDQVSIEDRPKHIELRLEAGHSEGDLVIGLAQKSAIATHVDRKTRYTLIMKLENRKSKTVTQAFATALNKLPPFLRRSMTYDNGIEMANHKWLTQQTGMKIYFAHPYCSHERGTNENTNGLIRRFFPKKTDFNLITQEQINFVQNNLNNRPRKVLGYATPHEMMLQEINDHNRKHKPISEITFG